MSLTANQTAAIPEAQGKQRHHDGSSSADVSTAANTPVSVASTARAPEVEAYHAVVLRRGLPYPGIPPRAAGHSWVLQ